uniref:Lig_chan-Glu_bd domain-containing protein n=1 Tax=Meloidogyne hapla TaxID=6305 RepID=A0A1I8BES4_MELHA
MRQLNLTEMSKKILKVVVPRIDPPYLNTINYNNQCNDVTMLYGPGIVWEILCDMANRLNLTYKIENVEVEGWGKRFDNDTWTGAFGRLNDGKAEILAGGSMMTPDRNKAFDFSDPIGYQSSSILIKVPRRENFVAQMLAYAFGWKAFTDDPEFSKIITDRNLVILVDSLENGIQTVQQFDGNAAFVAPSGRLRVLASLE